MWLGDRFREHLLAVKNKVQTCLNPWLDISIFQAIHTNTWKFAELTYSHGNNETLKTKEHRLVFKVRILAPRLVFCPFQFLVVPIYSAITKNVSELTCDKSTRLPTESMNYFYSHSFKHIFDQLDSTNFNQSKTWLFDPHKLTTNYLNTDISTIPQSAPTKG